MGREDFLIGAGQADLADSGGGLGLLQRQDPVAKVQHLTAKRDGAGGDEDDIGATGLRLGHVEGEGGEPVLLEAGLAVDEEGGAVITFDDTGAVLPPSAQAGVLSRDFEAIAPNRPRALSLIAAQSIAAHLHLVLDLEASPKGGTRVRVGLPRSTF